MTALYASITAVSAKPEPVGSVSQSPAKSQARTVAESPSPTAPPAERAWSSRSRESDRAGLGLEARPSRAVGGNRSRSDGRCIQLGTRPTARQLAALKYADQLLLGHSRRADEHGLALEVTTGPRGNPWSGRYPRTPSRSLHPDQSRLRHFIDGSGDEPVLALGRQHLVCDTTGSRHYEPHGRQAVWDAAAALARVLPEHSFEILLRDCRESSVVILS